MNISSTQLLFPRSHHKNPRLKIAEVTPVLALLAVFGFGGFASPVVAQTDTKLATMAHEDGTDAKIRPGDDFYAYANGEWLNTVKIPPGKTSWGARNEIDEKTKNQLASLIGEAVAWPPDSYQRKAADFCAAYLNEKNHDERGLTSLQPVLERINGVADKAALARLLGDFLRADVDPLSNGIFDSPNLFGLSVEEGIHGEKKHFAYLLQGGLGLSGRDLYFNASPEAQALRVKYQDYIRSLLELAGFEHADQRAEGVMALETAIAKTYASPEESANDRNADNHWALADFSSQAPGMDWSMFFAAAGLSGQKDIVVWQPGAIKGAAEAVASNSPDEWKDYLRFHAIDRYVEVLPRRFAERALEWRAAAISGAVGQGPREQRAIEALNKVLPEIVGRMYVEKYFPAETKTKLKGILANVIDAFRKRVEAVKWMTPETKTRARSRLRTMYFGIGYPEKWTDFSNLIIRADDAVGNLQRVSDFDYRRALAKLEKPVEVTEWEISPQTVGAIYQPLKNAYNFSAALLQAPKYDPAVSDAMNYGAIGAIVGHEISHFVDPLGAGYDDDGGTREWWTKEDHAQFDASCDALVRQFSSYHPFPNVPVNGKLTLSENVADLGGLAAAFDAYRRTLGRKATDREFVRGQDRQFFLGYARAWRLKMSDDALRKYVATNIHAPSNFRTFTVRNLDAWYEAFDVQPGQGLYLEPTERVRIW